MTSLADRKIYEKLKPQIKIPALNLNKQVVKKVKVENVEKMLKKCPKFEKGIRKDLEGMIREANPGSKAL